MKDHTQAPITVTFQDVEISILFVDNKPYIPLRTIVESLGLNWATQTRKINSNTKRWSPTVVISTTVAKDDKRREVLCLPKEKVFGFLCTISPSKIKRQHRAKLIAFQNECDRVLSEALSGQHRAAPQEDLIMLDRLQQELLLARPKWVQMKRYSAMGLETCEIAKLLDMGRSTVREHRRRMLACGIEFCSSTTVAMTK
ncbi:phage antirepressor N-terminal domain-containing protein [Magnetococcus sp. PR-3]|uniref:phage antirepressor N-terminal domain-containing protein n=1 Tax=Magnetococcus sp. PR-3 TaxID=3120355 RepID=UPI002FCE414F